MTVQSLATPSSDNQQVKSYEQAVRKGLKSVHVVKTDGKWVARQITSDAKAKETFRTKRKAVEMGKKLAQKNNASLYIHASDGKIRDKISFNQS